MMSDARVARWKQRGTVHCWRYRDNSRNYPGWNLAADEDACRSLLALIEFMSAAPYSSAQTIRLSPPSHLVLSVPGNRNGDARWTAARSLQLQYRNGMVTADHWTLDRDGADLTLSVGEASLAELRSGIDDMAHGRGDWGIGELPDEFVTYWWVPR